VFLGISYCHCYNIEVRNGLNICRPPFVPGIAHKRHPSSPTPPPTSTYQASTNIEGLFDRVKSHVTGSTYPLPKKYSPNQDAGVDILPFKAALRNPSFNYTFILALCKKFNLKVPWLKDKNLLNWFRPTYTIKIGVIPSNINVTA
jgi:hypothetical protein